MKIPDQYYSGIQQVVDATTEEYGYYPSFAVPEVIKKINNNLASKLVNETITPEEQNLLNILNDDASLSDAFVEGATYGFSAELQKNFSSLPPAFAEALQEYKLEDLYKTKPFKAGGTEVAGSIVPLIAGKGISRRIIAGQKAKPISVGTQPKKPVLVKVLEGIGRSPTTQSAIFGYTYGLGKTEGQMKDRVKKFQPYATALASAGTTLIVGGIANVIGELTEALVGSGDPQVARNVGRQLVLRALRSDKENVKDALEEAYIEMSQKNVGDTSATNKQITLADMGDNTKATMDLVNTLPGRGKAIVQKFLRNRAEGRLDRLQTDLRQAFGSDADFYEELGALIEQRKANGVENYKEAFNKTFNDGTKQPRVIAMDAKFETEVRDLTDGSISTIEYTLDDLFDTPAMSDAVEDAIRLANNDKRNFSVKLDKNTGDLIFDGGNLEGESADGVPLRFLHYVKMALDDTLFNEKHSIQKSLKRTEVAQIGQLRKGLLNIMDSIPEYEKARKIFAGDMALQEAMMDGLAVFKPSSEMPQVFMESFSNSEKESYRLGVMQAVIKQLEDGATGSDLAKRIFKNETRNKLLRQTFPEGEAGDKIFETFKNNFTNEMITRGTEISVQFNSKTAQRENFKELAENMLSAQTKLSKIKDPKQLFGTAFGIDFDQLEESQLEIMGEKIAEMLTETDARKLEQLVKGGRPFADAVVEVAPTIIPKIINTFAKLPNNPYLVSDLSSQILNSLDEEVEGLGNSALNALGNVMREATQGVSRQDAQVIKKDNFNRSTPTSVSEKVMPQERESIASQLDNMLANMQQSDIPLVPPVTSVTPEAMLSETILPNPDDREIAQRMMGARGIGSLMS